MLDWLEEEAGYDLVLWFQSWRSDFVTFLFKPFDLIGSEYFYILLIAFLYWTVNKSKGRSISLLFLFTMWINTFFKALWMRPRPFNKMVQGKQKIVPPFTPPTSYGLPSGHTMATVSFFSATAQKFKQNWVKVLAIILILFVPLSRLIHGMHYPQDIIIGYLFSFVILLIYLFIENYIEQWISSFGWWFILPLLLLINIIMIELPFILGLEIEYIKDIISLSGLISAGIIGFYIEYKVVKFEVKGTIVKKSIRILLGVSVLLSLKIGLSFAFKPINLESYPFWHLFIAYFRNAIVGFWFTVGAPLIFLLTGLASKEVSFDRKN